MIEQQNIGKNNDISKIKGFFKDQNIAEYLIQQYQQLKQKKQSFVWSLTAEKLHLYIYYHQITKKQPKEEEKANSNCQIGYYAIKISKGFPILGVRVYMLNHTCVPRIFDCRDLTQQILQQPWNYKHRIIQFFQKSITFQQKLQKRNNNYLSMQNCGKFKLGDIFDIHQLTKFSALNIFEDQNKQSGILIGTTQTHMLTFKLAPQPGKQLEKAYQLTRVCQLQCISQIYHNDMDGQVIVTFCKYSWKVQSFNDFQKISRKYKLEDTQQFLRNILKHIGNFQKININLSLKSKWNSQVENEKILKKLKQSKDLQQKLIKTDSINQKQQIKKILIQTNNKLVQYFSERAISYYLIYVQKIKHIAQNI